MDEETQTDDIQDDSQYSSLVFDRQTQEKYLDPKIIDLIDNVTAFNAELDLESADIIAAAMKDWAISKGATHYSFWIQTLVSMTSEKHNSFVVPEKDECGGIFGFSGKDLIKEKLEASSYPIGGERSIFEARGNTCWDVSSNVFIKDEVLCIPTALRNYKGEAIDHKTPFLRSMRALNSQVKRFMKLFNIDVERVDVNVGAEQEFFIISKQHYSQRDDLVITGHTLFGDSSLIEHEFDMNHFGSIDPKVNEFMKVLNTELWKLGIPAHAKHKEVAPSQMELAPIYSIASRAIDTNLLTMEKMTFLSRESNMAVLLDDQPFDGINGSSKHCSWSVSADGRNLLDPGKSTKELLRFTALTGCIIAAVDEYQELFRLSVASKSSDRRLGANGAPPTIVSVFLGKALRVLIDSVISSHSLKDVKEDLKNLCMEVIPWIMRDAADWNRKSPFAFNDKKFEFRMPGASANISDSIMILNAAVSKALSDFCDSVDLKYKEQKNGKNAEGDSSDNLGSIILDVCASTFSKHHRILFDKDPYSEKWEEEAKSRGLVNNKTVVDAAKILKNKSTTNLFKKFNILSDDEIAVRYYVILWKYIKDVKIECKVMLRMVRRLYLPAISFFANQIAREMSTIVRGEAGYSQIYGGVTKTVCNIATAVKKDSRLAIVYHRGVLEKFTGGLRTVGENTKNLEKLLKEDDKKKYDDVAQQADFYANEVTDAMAKLRESVDKLEHITPPKYWPVPSYDMMLLDY